MAVDCSNSSGKRLFTKCSSSFGLTNVTVSLCNTTANQRHVELMEAIEHSHECTRQRLQSLSCVLDELVAKNCITFQEAFDQFSGKVPSIAGLSNKKEARRQFKEKILSKNGLPVLFLRNRDHTFVLLVDHPLDNISLCKSLDFILNCQDTSNASDRFESELASSIPSLMKLLSTAKDRAILTFVLSSIFSPTKLALALGMNNHRAVKLRETVHGFLSEMDKIEHEVESKAQKSVEDLICKLKTEIDVSEKEMKIKGGNLHDEEVEIRNFDIDMTKERLSTLQGTSQKDITKRMSRRLLHKWKQNLLSQRGKGKGNYRIDRRAERAVYEVLQEQLKAHARRWGEEGTGYLEHEQRIQSKEMLQIANR